MGFSVTNGPTLKLTGAGVLLAALAACGSSSGNDGPIERQPDEVTIEAVDEETVKVIVKQDPVARAVIADASPPGAANGWCVLPDGSQYVAVRTRFSGCTASMLEGAPRPFLVSGPVTPARFELALPA